MNDLFFELIRVSLGVQPHLSRVLSLDEWRDLYNIAEKQALIGICFEGVRKEHIRNKLPQTLYLKWMGVAIMIKNRNEKINNQCVDLQYLMANAGYNICIFKGQTVGALYDTINLHNELETLNRRNGTIGGGLTDLSMLRIPGDIDIWVQGGYSRVVNLVNQFCPTQNIRETHAQLNIYDGTIVEAHYRPGLIRNFITNYHLQKFFKDQEEECFKNFVKFPNIIKPICTPTWEFNVIHQLSHIFHHLFAGGVGLRQVMDLYFVLKISSESHSYLSLNTTIAKCGMKRFCAALMWVLQYVFRLESELMICPSNEKDGRFLLKEIMLSGNFGQRDKRNKRYNSKSYLQNFTGIIFRNVSYVRFAPFDWMMSPIWRLYYFCWRKIKGFQ